MLRTKITLKNLLKNSQQVLNFPTDDAPPTFYKGFNDYEETMRDWVKEMGKTYGWEVYDYLISDTITKIQKMTTH